MSEGDDGAAGPPGSPKKPGAPRPGVPGRVKPPPPVPTAAKGTAPLAPKVNPFLERESIRDLDAGWLSAEESAEPPLPPPAPEAPPEPTPIPQVAALPEPPRIEPPDEPPPIAAPPPRPVPIARVEEIERASVPPPEAKRSRVKVIAFVLFAGIALVGGGLAYQRETARSPKVGPTAPQSSANASTASAEPLKSVVEAVPPPTSNPEPPPSASAPKKPAAVPGAAGAGAGVAPALSGDPSKTGIVDSTPLPPGRKIVVDGRLVGTSPGRVVVRCGSHRFQIGELPPETLDLPCGGELTFSD